MFVIVGPSGAGKGAIAAGLVERVPGLWLSRSWTTRPRRPSDAPGAYVFVDRATFEAHRDADGFVEWDEHFGHLYGTPRLVPPPGADILLEIDVIGAAEIRRRYPDAVIVLVKAPSRPVLEERLRRRGEDDATVAGRLARAELEEQKGAALADHVVVNDDLQRAVDEVTGIVEAHRSRAAAPPRER